MPYKNKEKENEYHRYYYHQHKEKYKIWMNRWINNNKEHIKEYRRRPEIKKKSLQSQKKWISNPLNRKKKLKYWRERNKRLRSNKDYRISEYLQQRNNIDNSDYLKIKRKIRNRNYYNKNKDKINKYRREHYTKTPIFKIKKNIRQTAKRTIPLKESCRICGSKENLQRHHWNYNKPELVNTLCKFCHNVQHRKYS